MPGIRFEETMDGYLGENMPTATPIVVNYTGLLMDNPSPSPR
jgi:hypothetical protein